MHGIRSFTHPSVTTKISSSTQSSLFPECFVPASMPGFSSKSNFTTLSTKKKKSNSTNPQEEFCSKRRRFCFELFFRPFFGSSVFLICSWCAGGRVDGSRVRGELGWRVWRGEIYINVWIVFSGSEWELLVEGLAIADDGSREGAPCSSICSSSRSFISFLSAVVFLFLFPSF